MYTYTCMARILLGWATIHVLGGASAGEKNGILTPLYPRIAINSYYRSPPYSPRKATVFQTENIIFVLFFLHPEKKTFFFQMANAIFIFFFHKKIVLF